MECFASDRSIPSLQGMPFISYLNGANLRRSSVVTGSLKLIHHIWYLRQNIWPDKITKNSKTFRWKRKCIALNRDKRKDQLIDGIGLRSNPNYCFANYWSIQSFHFFLVLGETFPNEQHQLQVRNCLRDIFSEGFALLHRNIESQIVLPDNHLVLIRRHSTK